MEKVLVCVLASTRSHELSWVRFRKFVLDPLCADLALAITFSESYDYSNPFWQHARFRWTAPEFEDAGEGFDYAQAIEWRNKSSPPDNWRCMLAVGGLWQGGIKGGTQHKTHTAHAAFFCRWLLTQGLLSDSILNKYDRIIVTRSDYFWLAPHPPMTLLSREFIWFPDGENWCGLNDRHMVVSTEDAIQAINILSDIIFHPTQLVKEMTGSSWGPERFIAHHFERHGLAHKVQRFPHVMYLAKNAFDGTPTWSSGKLNLHYGHMVKYEDEYRQAIAHANCISTTKDWHNNEWRSVDVGSYVDSRKPTVKGLAILAAIRLSAVKAKLFQLGPFPFLFLCLRRCFLLTKAATTAVFSIGTNRR